MLHVSSQLCLFTGGYSTHAKLKMEPENEVVQKESPLPGGIFSGSSH